MPKDFERFQYELCDSPDNDLGGISWSELPIPRIFWAYVVSEYLGVIDCGIWIVQVHDGEAGKQET